VGWVGAQGLNKSKEAPKGDIASNTNSSGPRLGSRQRSLQRSTSTTSHTVRSATFPSSRTQPSPVPTTPLMATIAEGQASRNNPAFTPKILADLTFKRCAPLRASRRLAGPVAWH
jgi:hypothetical protein